ncbi:glutathione synthetase [Vibrio sp. 10N.286.49.C2]|uniref:SemiSWEET transporter n=1 Tax=unclassified Vibrio TaxID=2614977 RepID=UPI000C863F12|nr:MULTISPECIES: SemiSWEET transporter [unclassified Vibrio]PMH38140.1 glutathione synthetase [Vibrio sp. 10N.286.49.C2]PMH53654.1 glutathione synthetase [Vibrio sp. 10N.286.49.B1]PMH79029.1 glutathione synthetase [Vibrio sp. 10N.286.48.B7]
MMDITLLGYLAAICTTCSFVPQVLHILKTRNTDSISLMMYSIFVSGVALWLIYGLLIDDLPIVVANSITFILASTILSLKVRDVASLKSTNQNKLGQHHTVK